MVSVSKISFKQDYKPNNLMAEKIYALNSSASPIISPISKYNYSQEQQPTVEPATKIPQNIPFVKKNNDKTIYLSALGILSSVGICVYSAIKQKNNKKILSGLTDSLNVAQENVKALKDSLEIIKSEAENPKLLKQSQSLLSNEDGSTKFLAGSFVGAVLSILGYKTVKNGENIEASVIENGYNEKISNENSNRYLKYGAMYRGENKTDFCYLAPNFREIKVEISRADENYKNIETLTLNKKDNIFSAKNVDLKPKDRYRLLVQDYSGNSFYTYDPYANYIPNDISPYENKILPGVKKTTIPRTSPNWAEVVDHSSFVWSDSEWIKNRKTQNNDMWSLPKDMVAEEVHIGLLGGYQGAKKYIDKISNDGIANTIKLMPIGEFYGKSNWGYDESCKYAPESSYGSPNDLKSLVNYAHKKNIRVILDVVPNHFGPLGSNIAKFMPIFSKNNEYTPWGKKLEFNQNSYALDYMTNMMMNWALNYHIDGFRLDSTQNVGSDSALWHFMNEIRNCDETKDLIVYPEDSRISRAMANKNLDDKKIGEYNWGYNAQTTYDFSKELMALVTNRKIYGTEPSILGLEDIFKKGIHSYHEDIVKNEPMASDEYRKYCREISKFPNASENNLLIGVSNHDEIGNTAGGRRGISNILYFSLDLDSRFFDYDNNPKWQQENNFIYNLLDSYMKTGKILSKDKQKEMGCALPITQEEFEDKYKRAVAYNKLMIASMLMHPSPKEYFMGDTTGEVSPFRYFCDIPPERLNSINDITNEKGYSPNLETFEMCKPSFTMDNQTPKQKELSDSMTAFSRDVIKCVKSNPALLNASFDTIRTYAHSDKNILEVAYKTKSGDEAVGVFNFSDKAYDNFGLSTLHDKQLRKDISSNDKQYGGNENTNNEIVSSNSISLSPLSVSIYSKV